MCFFCSWFYCASAREQFACDAHWAPPPVGSFFFSPSLSQTHTHCERLAPNILCKGEVCAPFHPHTHTGHTHSPLHWFLWPQLGPFKAASVPRCVCVCTVSQFSCVYGCICQWNSFGRITKLLTSCSTVGHPVAFMSGEAENLEQHDC